MRSMNYGESSYWNLIVYHSYRISKLKRNPSIIRFYKVNRENESKFKREKGEKRKRTALK